MSVPSNLIPTRITQLPIAPTASEDSMMLIVYQGVSYQIRVGDLLSVAGVPTTRQVIAGTGLVGGGQLTENVTLSIGVGAVGTTQLANTGVTAGVYGSVTEVPVLTVDETGRVTAASVAPIAVSGYVPTSREVIAGDGLTGGGALTTNITLTVDLSNLTPTSIGGVGDSGTSTEVSRADHQHPAVDLADDVQVDGLLGLDHGGTAKSLVPNAGAVVWSGADGLYISPAGSAGQVLVSGGTSAPTWGSALIVSDQAANTVYAGPTSGPDAPTAFRALVNADLPTSGATAGTYGSATQVAQVTVNSKGVVTSVTEIEIESTAPVTSVNGQTGDVVLDAADIGAVSSVNGETGVVVLTPADIGAAASGANSDITSMTGITGGISTPDFVQFDTSITPTVAVGKLQWDPTWQGLQVGMGGGNVNLQIGQESVIYVYNNTGSALSDGQVVYVSGSQGQRLTVALAQATSDATSATVLGMVTEPIANNASGFVTVSGMVNGVNTTGATDGDPVWLSPTTAGAWTTTKPVAPNHLVLVGYVVKGGSAGAGSLYIHPQNGYELNELHDVLITSVANNDALLYDSVTGVWRNRTAQVTINTLAGGVTSGQFLRGNGTNVVLSAIQASDVPTLNQNTTGTAAAVAGGAASQILYQSGSGVTAFIANGTAGQVLKSNGASAPAWGGISGGTF